MPEALAAVRKAIKTGGHYPDGEAANKLIWLALCHIPKKWDRSAHDWQTVMNQFALHGEERFIQPSVCWSIRLEPGMKDTPSRHSRLRPQGFRALGL